MAADRAGRRVSYDKVWGTLLLATCALPVGAGEGRFLWQRDLAAASAVEIAWLAAGSVAGALALVLGVLGLRGRGRHLANFLLGTVTLALPLLDPSIWARYPWTNPARLPLGGLGSVGWVILCGLAAVYAGSGMRVARPSQFAGQALGALGAFLIAAFALMPVDGGGLPVAVARMQLAFDTGADWPSMVPLGLVAAAVLFGLVNLLRTRAEVPLAKASRLLLAAALLFWVALPFLEFGKGGDLARHLPVAWGALRFFGPLFLAIDGCVAYAAISFTRASD
jgi:hypothetical protein